MATEIQLLTYHDVKLLWFSYKLHTTVVNNDLIVSDPWILFSHLSARLQEQTISKFHNVSLVHCRHFLPVVQVRILKRILRYTLRTKLRDHLKNRLQIMRSDPRNNHSANPTLFQEAMTIKI